MNLRTFAPSHLRALAPLCVLVVLTLSSILMAQQDGLNPADILKPLSDSWPTYSGDYSGRRHSALTQINQANIRMMSK